MRIFKKFDRDIININGIGIINVAHIYGAVCISEKNKIDLVVKLEEWDANHFYDRVGLEEKMEQLADEMERLRVENSRTIGENEQLVVEVERLRVEVEVLQSGGLSLSEDNDRLVELNSELSGTRAEAEARASELEAGSEALKEQLDTAQTRIAELEQDNRDLSQACADIGAKLPVSVAGTARVVATRHSTNRQKTVAMTIAT